MKILLIGYGRMGREVEAIAGRRGHGIAGRIDPAGSAGWDEQATRQADVAIEFTTPGSAADNILRCLDLGLPVVCGTTGWYDRLDEVRARCNERNGALLYASNFSIGVNLLFELNRRLAALMARQPDYAVRIREVHHVHKLDKPSGTALTLAEGILGENRNLARWELSEEGPAGSKDTLPVHSVREDEVPGIHEVEYRSDADMLTLRHEAFNRTGFAAGAVQAAEWLPGRTGVFTMHDLLQSLTQV